MNEKLFSVIMPNLTFDQKPKFVFDTLGPTSNPDEFALIFVNVG